MRARFAAAPLILLIVIVSFAQRPPTSHAQGSADNVRDIDLAKMVLPLSAFGPEYASFELLTRNVGFDAGTVLPHQLSTFGLIFTRPADQSVVGIAAAGSATAPIDSADNAKAFVTEAMGGFQQTIEQSGGTFSTFPVDGLSAAIGFKAILPESEPSRVLQETGVEFPSGRLVGAVVFVNFNQEDLQPQAIAAATALNDHMKGVLTGKITDFAAPLPPDVNCNGSLDAIDASLELQLGAGLVASLPCGALGDANQDGQINAIDASLILQYSAGLIDRLPVAG